jgi:dTDP-L-rhamnose 4-epimerase
MSDTVLVTGGAGFIGSHVVERLLAEGRQVRVLDSLVPQVHGARGPRYVPDAAEFILADVCDRDAMRAALTGVTTVVHLAAEVGVGQSMYEISRYVDANTGGTAVMLDLLANSEHTVSRIVVASSMSIYGEGSYRCAEHGLVTPGLRPDAQLAARQWDPLCPACSRALTPVPTREDKALLPTSVYAISKMDQELLCLSVGAAYGIDVVALRYFNSYGPRQAIGNPYTGVAAIFGGRLLAGKSPVMFEDGEQLRDFVHVRDVARATVLATHSQAAVGRAINVGAGAPMTIRQVAEVLARELGRDIEPEVSDRFRSGDIRHCWADTTLARELLGFAPEIPLSDGVAELVEWLGVQEADDHVDAARAELEKRGLAR